MASSALEIVFVLFAFTVVINFLSLFQVDFLITVYRITYPATFQATITELGFADILLASAAGFSVLLISGMRKPAVIIPGVGYLAFGMMSAIYSEQLGYSFFSISFPMIFLIPFFIRRYSKTRFDVTRVLLTVAVALTIFELLSLLRWMSYPVFNSRIYSDLSWIFAQREGYLSAFIGSAAPYLLVALVFSYLFKPVIEPYRRK
ncbi:MAG: hypothetical protein ACRD4B_02345, partial [Acidobacteriota bacterium]